MDYTPKKNMIEETIEDEMTMFSMPEIPLTPCSNIGIDGTPYSKYSCSKCGKGLLLFSTCDCTGESTEPTSFELLAAEVDDEPTSLPKLEPSISSYTKDGVTTWRYPCGVCDRGLPSAFSFCCCSKCGKRTPGYDSPCIWCPKK
jgi:hypothetical protein